MTDLSPNTLTELLEKAANRYGNRIAIASREGLRTRVMTYPDLFRASEAAANAVRGQFGMQPGDRVVLWAPNSIRLVAVQFGLLRAGIIAVPLDRNSRVEFVEAVMRNSGATALIGGRSAPAVDEGMFIAMEDIELSGKGPFTGPSPEPDDVALLVYTSGTTGDPKGAVLTHRNIVSNVRAAAEIIPEGVRLDLLSILPLSHMLEQTAGLYLPLLSGGSVRYAPSLNSRVIVREIRRYRATGMVVVPRFLWLINDAVQRHAEESGLGGLWRLRIRVARRLPIGFRKLLFPLVHKGLGGKLSFFLCGGARLPAESFALWESLGVRVIEGYGATECAPVIASNSYRDRASNSVGRPLSGIETRLSEEGELLVRGSNVFTRYWQDDERTASAFTPDGWFRTGDLAEIAANGRIHISGRLADRIVLSSGMNVDPEDVEAALSVEDEVAECAVVGLKAADDREEVHAVIRPGNHACPQDVADAVARTNRRLASHQRILGFTIWQGDFPRTSLQKIKRKSVRMMLSSDAAVSQPARPEEEDSLGLAAKLLRRVAPQFPGPIHEDARLETDLGLDSLQRVELAALIEAETGMELSEEDLNRLETAGEMRALLAAPQGPPDRPEFPDWPLSPFARAGRGFLQSVGLFPLYSLLCRPFRREGVENLESISSPVLFVANHTSHVDTVSILRALPTAIRRRTAVAAASDYFYAKPVLGWFTSLLLNTFPFSRSGQVKASLERCGELCDEGWSILIYPEGTRSPDGRLLPFKRGIGLLAAGLGVPVVPIGVTGGHEILPKGAGWPRRGAARVRFGTPVMITEDMAAEGLPELLRDAVANELEKMGPRSST